MKPITYTTIFIVSALAMLPSCSNTDKIFKALKIEPVPDEKKKSADQKTIDDLNKQLAAARSKETTLSQQIAKMEKELNQQGITSAEQISSLRRDFEQQQGTLTEEIKSLKNEIRDQEMIISIQEKVIGLLDDADNTLQNSIKAQIEESKY